MKLNSSSKTRVALSSAVFAIALFGLPSVAKSDRTAAAPAPAELALAAAEPSTAVTPPAEPAVSPAPETVSAFDPAAWQEISVGNIDSKVFGMALNAAAAALERGHAADPGTLTVIDFSRPSTVDRMWVYDLRSRKLLFEEVVSHGRGSGRTMATAFSNDPESYQSSLGLYRTAETYIGKHGYSLRLDGLEPGVNDRARERAIVMHGADYVDPRAAQAQGYLGRSLGCPALRPAITRELIDAVKDGGLLFAYYPDPQWLQNSRYVSVAP
jgi:hypothetical protein